MLACRKSGFLDVVGSAIRYCDVAVNSESIIHGVTSPSSERDSVELTAIELAVDLIQYYVSTGENHRNPAIDRRHTAVGRYAVTLRRIADKIAAKHSIYLDGLTSKLNLNDGNVIDVLGAFQKTIEKMFADGVFNWGRLGTAYAFAGVLVRNCFRSGVIDQGELDSVASSIGALIAQKIGTWIRTNGGWDQFEQFFAEPESPEKILWRGLLVTTAVGLSAMAAVVMTR